MVIFHTIGRFPGGAAGTITDWPEPGALSASHILEYDLAALDMGLRLTGGGLLREVPGASWRASVLAEIDRSAREDDAVRNNHDEDGHDDHHPGRRAGAGSALKIETDGSVRNLCNAAVSLGYMVALESVEEIEEGALTDVGAPGGGAGTGPVGGFFASADAFGLDDIHGAAVGAPDFHDPRTEALDHLSMTATDVLAHAHGLAGGMLGHDRPEPNHASHAGFREDAQRAAAQDWLEEARDGRSHSTDSAVQLHMEDMPRSAHVIRWVDDAGPRSGARGDPQDLSDQRYDEWVDTEGEAEVFIFTEQNDADDTAVFDDSPALQDAEVMAIVMEEILRDYSEGAEPPLFASGEAATPGPDFTDLSAGALVTDIAYGAVDDL
ncbi:MAG: hypothetical protein CML50_07365 [Rhodobacteraceae bacterium]|jgi:hypothetical protein|nr:MULTISPECIES: hypothetical protein [Salipiger]MAB05818.1 hypothetical protein [Paracoccaceae bacterium]GGA09734.1 hypothetical protein GCM10011326_21850 [Salipiger profundus]SFC61049.1 hypothetical protein SAMN05444415_104125 [Salipiger profundus]